MQMLTSVAAAMEDNACLL